MSTGFEPGNVRVGAGDDPVVVAGCEDERHAALPQRVGQAKDLLASEIDIENRGIGRLFADER